MKIAFIGIGVMGRSMALHLIKDGGHELQVYTRTKAKAADVLAAGAKWCDTVKEAATGVEVVMTMVGFPSDVEEVYFGPAGILENAAAGALLIDFTTTKPSLEQQIHAEAQKRGLRFLDAPVSGGDTGAREARLSIMVGGDKADFDAAVPLFENLGKTIVYQGPTGSGQHAKMCNQIAIASGMIGVMESLLYARRSGLDPDTVLKSIATGAAASWSLSNYVPRVLKDDFKPGFYVEHFLKDIRIALEECEKMGIEAPGLKLTYELYLEVEKMGGAKLGTQSIYKALEARSTPADKK